MKKFTVIMSTIALAGILWSVSPSVGFAADVVIDTKIAQATTALDKNGREYVRLLIEESRSLQGVNYTVTVPVMAFGRDVQKAKEFKAGDALKCIAAARDYNGNTSYTIRAFIDSQPQTAKK